MTDKKLMEHAAEAREQSYSPYSNFMVGAALLAKDGQVFHGCNIENAAYTPTNCAERTAFFKAVSQGVRGFDAIAITGGPKGEPGYAYPCGVCRQVMMEFCEPETFRVLVGSGSNDFKSYTLKDLLPHGFGPQDLD